MEATVTHQLKGYELRERIGAGGFGAVYSAFQTTVGREVAIKIILPGLANQPEFIRRFEGEAQIVARLEHPHIVPLHDYWRDPEGAYLVMRRLRGGSLRDALQQGAFDLRSAALFLDQVADALSLAHRHQVIHRDIKPGNILLDEDGNAYLTDFGIAKDLNLPGSNTLPDAIVGSLDYISPEQARSEPITARTDIYSLGVTLYEAITGEHPFQNLSSIERLYKHINDPLPDITTLDTAVTTQVNRVIQKATAKNPNDRYADALTFATDFRESIGMNRPITSAVELLTQREQEILQLLIDGLSNKEIAQRATVTLSTVKWHVNQIYSRLGVRSRVQAIVRARELNLLTKSSQEHPFASVPTEDFHPDNPYKGLRAFQSADNQDFFGREKVTAKLVKRLEEAHDFARFLAVIGPSGSGKSSLVKAGLIPALWRGEMPGSEKWFVVELLPGMQPLDELEIALTRVAANHAGSLHEQLVRDRRGLIRAAQLILPADGSELVLVIDQFEEVFTLLEDETTRTQFLDLLYTAVTEARSRVRIILTLRADFYDRPLNYPEFGELVRSRLETIMPLSAEELERAIMGPAKRVEVTFEPGLAAGIIADVNYQPGALPLLQYALTELFEQRQGHVLTREAYQAIGGTVGALANRAEEVYLSMDETEREVIRQLFLRLVTPGEGTEDTRRRVTRSELLAIAPEADMMDEIIDTFASYRLVSLDTDAGTRAPTVEVAHEALLRSWERLRGWLTESRDEIKVQRQLGTMAAEWRESGQDSSFLARGSRLNQFEAWAKDTRLALTTAERAYLDASIVQRDLEAKAESEQKAREKVLERRSLTFLRGLVAVLVLATLGAFGLSGVALNQSRIADQNAVRADRNAAETQNVALTAGSQAALANGSTDQAIALALEAVRLDPSSAPAQVALGEAAYAPGTIRQLIGHTGEVWGVAFSPDGRTAVSGGDDKALMLWDVATGAMIRRFADGHTEGHIKVAFSPNGQTVLSGAADGQVILWDVATGNIIRHFEGHTGWIGDVKFSPDGRTALSCGKDKTLILWDVATGASLKQFGGSTDILTVDLSPDGRYALSGGSLDTFVYLWDVTTGETIRRFEGHTRPLRDVKFSPDGQQALSGAADGSPILWDVATGQIVRRLCCHSGEVHRVVFSPDGRYALSGASDKTVRLWDLRPGYIVRQFAGHMSWVMGFVISPNGLTVLSASWAGTASLTDLQTGQDLYRLTEPIALNGSAYSPDGHTAIIAEGNGGGSIRDEPGGIIVWNLDTGQIIRRIAYPQPVIAIAFRPDGRTFLSGAADGSVVLWDVATGEIIRHFAGHNVAVINVAFNPDGRTALTGATDGSLFLWAVDTGQLIQRFVGQTDLVGHIAFSKDGHAIVTDGAASGSYLWDTASGTLLRHLDGGHVFSPDDKMIFGYAGSAMGQNSDVVIDLATSNTIRRFTGFDGIAVQSRFTLNGHSVLIGFSNGKMQEWRMDTLDELIAWTRANRYIPELTCDQHELYRLEPRCEPETGSSPAADT